MKGLPLAILILILNLVSCSSATSPREDFFTRIYDGTYDDVWLATLKALNDYPLKLTNKDATRIQSEIINGPYNEMLFTHPEPLQLPEKFRFALKFSFGKLESENRAPMIRVRVTKELEHFQDFYTGWTPYPSDGLEEKLLLYRIALLLAIERSLSKSTPNPLANPPH